MKNNNEKSSSRVMEDKCILKAIAIHGSVYNG